MKQLTLSLAILALFLSGCVTTGDPVVVNAEKSTRVANDTIDAFLKLEWQNQVVVKAKLPQIHSFANSLRQPDHAQKWLEDARTLTAAYKNNRSADNKANLQTILATLTAAEQTAASYTTQITQLPK